MSAEHNMSVTQGQIDTALGHVDAYAKKRGLTSDELAELRAMVTPREEHTEAA